MPHYGEDWTFESICFEHPIKQCFGCPFTLKSCLEMMVFVGIDSSWMEHLPVKTPTSRKCSFRMNLRNVAFVLWTTECSHWVWKWFSVLLLLLFFCSIRLPQKRIKPAINYSVWLILKHKQAVNMQQLNARLYSARRSVFVQLRVSVQSKLFLQLSGAKVPPAQRERQTQPFVHSQVWDH